MRTLLNPQNRRLSSSYNGKKTQRSILRMIWDIVTTLSRTHLTTHQKATTGCGRRETLMCQRTQSKNCATEAPSKYHANIEKIQAKTPSLLPLKINAWLEILPVLFDGRSHAALLQHEQSLYFSLIRRCRRLQSPFYFLVFAVKLKGRSLLLLLFAREFERLVDVFKDAGVWRIC